MRAFRGARVSVAAVFLLCAAAGRARAFTRTWTGFISTDWFEMGNWDTGLPVADDDVIIPGGKSVVLTNATPTLRSLVNSGSFVFSTTNACLRAVSCTNNGSITHNINTATSTNAAGRWVPDNRVFVLCTDLTVSSGGSIDVSSKGYQGNVVIGTGYGPGGGQGYAGAARGGGGGYGGHGGQGYWSGTYTAGGQTYGSSNAPMDPGSAGGSYRLNAPGGAGGGAVRIQATGRVTIDGTIAADGQSIGSDGPAGGSGGAIYISCSTFTGTGTVRANGGSTPKQEAGGGGGGRIAIEYNPAQQQGVSPKPSVYLSADRGYGRQVSIEPGTLSLSDHTFFPTDTRAMGGGQILIPTFPNAWAGGSMTLNGWLEFQPGVQLDVTNQAQITGSLGRLDLTSNGVLHCGQLVVDGGGRLYGGLSYADRPSVVCTGSLAASSYGVVQLCNGSLSCRDLSLASFAALYVYAGPTNDLPGGSAALVNAGDVRVGTNSSVYAFSHPTSGGTPLFLVGSLTLDSAAQINADGKGFQGVAGGTGYGDGGGGVDSYRGGGGGYGGEGGDGIHWGGTGGGTYGSSNAPVEAGSAGGGRQDRPDVGPGGSGGGCVRIEAAGEVVINGTVSANGANSGNTSVGGGAGGGIYILCRSFAGSGTIRANGGAASGDGNGWSGGGGGGRIAVWRMTDDWQGSLSVSNSVAGGYSLGNPGQPGTVVIGTPLPSETLIIVR